jgi:hypothetical protein
MHQIAKRYGLSLLEPDIHIKHVNRMNAA